MKSCSVTDIGQKRKMNQDYVYRSDAPVGVLPDLYIVADGMGGHRAGDYASRFSVEEMVRQITEGGGESTKEIIGKALRRVNSQLYYTSGHSEEMKGCGTTIVIAVVTGDELLCANVGDSRLYILGETIRQVTVDHSLVQEMVEAGSLGRDKARTHPDKNVITRAVGAENYIDVDFFRTRLYPGDLLLLCTDGLTNMVEDKRILAVVQQHHTLEAQAQALIREANAAGGADNISVLLVDPFGKR